jgi:hypothetical protein
VQEFGIKVETGNGVDKITKTKEGFELDCEKGKVRARNVLVTIGGHPNSQAYDLISELGHTIVRPVPSLFTFNDAEKKFKDLMGVSVPHGFARIAGTKFSQQGPVLITHWGLSGPAIIKLSAWAAAYLHERKYEVTVLVSWIGNVTEEETRAGLHQYKVSFKKRKIHSYPLFELPQRLWSRICEEAEIPEDKIWDELPNRNLNKLMELLIRCPFRIKGKTTFKEEFVTCGGVDLKELDLETMQSRKLPGLYFAGEVLHVDGETGGFNFQAAWTTAFVAASHISKK